MKKQTIETWFSDAGQELLRNKPNDLFSIPQSVFDSDELNELANAIHDALADRAHRLRDGAEDKALHDR